MLWRYGSGNCEGRDDFSGEGVGRERMGELRVEDIGG